MSFSANLDDVVAENHSKLLGKHPSWARVRLKEVATVLNGFAFKSFRFSKSEGTPLIRIRDILRGETETFYQGEVDETYLVRAGDILVGMDGDFNCAEWAGEPGLLNQRVCKITPNEEFYSRRFLLYTLPGYLTAINEHTSSITVKHLSSRTVEDIPLPLPPRAEQERIVAKLDSMMSRVAAGEAAVRRALDRLQRYRAAVLHAAVTGRLTADWRKIHKPDQTAAQLLNRILKERRADWEKGEFKRLQTVGKPPKDDSWKKHYPIPASVKIDSTPSIPAGWTYASLDQLLFNITDGDHQPPPKVKTGIPLIVIGNLRNGELDFRHTRFVSKRYADSVGELRKPRRNDILYSLVGTFGLVVLVKTNREFCIQRHIAILRPHRLSPVEFLTHALNSHFVFRQAERSATGTAQRTVPLASLRRFTIPLPPMAEQKEIVREVERRLAAADDLASALKRQIERAKATRKSLLREALRGSLVPQDLNDEPAAAMLQRIRVARAAEVASRKKGRRETMPKGKKQTASMGFAR